MKKTTFWAAFALGAAMIVTGCGGGSGNTGGGKIKSNKYIGKIPAIYTAREEAMNEADAKVQRLVDDGKSGDARKFWEEWEAGGDEREAKFEADLYAEIEAVAGRDIPVTISEGLKNSDELFFTIESAKLTVCEPDASWPAPQIALKFSAAEGKSLGGQAHVLAVNSTGAVITLGSYSLPESGETELNIIYPIYSPWQWEDFAGIEFCTKAERDVAREERMIRDDRESRY